MFYQKRNKENNGLTVNLWHIYIWPVMCLRSTKIAHLQFHMAFTQRWPQLYDYLMDLQLLSLYNFVFSKLLSAFNFLFSFIL